MRPFWHKDNEKGYYRCLCKERGYESCGQGFIEVDVLDKQVVAILNSLTVPDDFRDRVEEAVQNRVENAAALERMAEIQEIIERVDFRWDHGFISAEEYIQKRAQLERELDAMRPIDYDELIEVADLLEHFQVYWNQCAEVENPQDVRQQLLHKIVERVFVLDGNVLAIVLYGDFGVVLGANETASLEIADAIEKEMATNGVSITRSRCGSDGLGTLTNRAVFARKSKQHRFVLPKVLVAKGRSLALSFAADQRGQLPRTPSMTQPWSASWSRAPRG
jgi:hypothetical protein